MRVECSHCRELIEVAGLTAVSGGLGFVCDRCGGESVLAPMAPPASPAAVRVSAPPSGPAPPSRPAAVRTSAPPANPAPPSSPAAVPAGHVVCPKCGAIQTDSRACHRCGLVFARVAEGRARLPSAPPVAPALRGRWEMLRGQLDDQAAHFAFIDACSLQGALEYAGYCYRGLTPVGQAEDPRIAVFRDRVLRQAAAQVQAFATPRPAAEDQRRVRQLVGALALAFILAVFAAGYWLLARFPTPH